MEPRFSKVSIFLASPGDVAKERSLVQEVVASLNRTVAAEKELVLEVTRWETNAYPGYQANSDAQAILNEQIALRMQEYELFIGIMWNRVGTPTARSASGTVEEFERAVESHKTFGRPEIWFYFRDQTTAEGDSEIYTKQQEGVLEFKQSFQRHGLPFDYSTPEVFRVLLHDQLLRWLRTRYKLPASRQNPPEPSTTNVSAEPACPNCGISGHLAPLHQTDVFELANAVGKEYLSYILRPKKVFKWYKGVKDSEVNLARKYFCSECKMMCLRCPKCQAFVKYGQSAQFVPNEPCSACGFPLVPN